MRAWLRLSWALFKKGTSVEKVLVLQGGRVREGTPACHSARPEKGRGCGVTAGEREGTRCGEFKAGKEDDSGRAAEQQSPTRVCVENNVLVGQFAVAIFLRFTAKIFSRVGVSCSRIFVPGMTASLPLF